MLFHLLFQFAYPRTQWPVLNVTRYITFRTAAASLTALAISLALGPWLVRKLREFQIGQVIRQEGPTTHRPKAGTPTMGGLLILTAAFVPTLLWADLTNVYVWIAVLTTAGFGAIGFMDDYLKIVRRSHYGLRPRYKIGWQIVIAAAVGGVLLVLSHNGLYSTRLIFPFFKRLIPDLGWGYLPFTVFVLVAWSNAVNLTDGLDGLAISTFAIAATTYTALTYVVGNRVLADYLLLVHFSPVAELTVFCGSLVGASLGIPLVQLVPRRNLHGRRRIAGARRRGCHGGHPDQTGAAARDRGRHLRARGALGRHPGRLVQDDRPARLQDGADPSPLRARRLERAEGDHALRDRRDHLRLVQPDDVEAAMTFDVSGKRVTVAGAARSGLAAAELLARRGADVTLSEARSDVPALEPLRALGVQLELGGHLIPTFANADLVVLSPGVPPEQAAIQAARDRGVPIIGELELAARWLQGRVIAITGTKGKSTTTALTGRMLEAAGFKVAVGGNIGAPLSAQVSASTPDTLHVVEASSFQLEQIETFHPWIAVMLNFSPDHLDRHPSVEAYGAAKARIFENQEAGDWAVINADDPSVLELARRGRAARRLFARSGGIAEGTVVEHGWIVDRTRDRAERLVPVGAIHLLGPHLVNDVMAAATVGAIAGAAPEAMTAAVDAFHGLEHAMELVADVGGVRFVNDSKATNVESALRSIESFDRGLVPIMGGRFKGGDLALLRGPLAARARAVVAIGEARGLIRDALAGPLPVHEADSFGEAVDRAYALAKPAGVVLLAPACASFDMFRDYAERGRKFKEEVARIARREQ